MKNEKRLVKLNSQIIEKLEDSEMLEIKGAFKIPGIDININVSGCGCTSNDRCTINYAFCG